MRKMLVLMALTLMTANSVGCCCCRGLRDWLVQGSCCPLLSGASSYPTATYVPATYAPAPICASPCAQTCTPTYTPAYAAAPMAAMAAPQYTMAAPMAMSAPMATSCGDPCASSCSPCSSGCSTCGSPCAAEASCGTPMVMGTAYQAEPSCSYSDGAAPAPTAVYPSPAAE